MQKLTDLSFNDLVEHYLGARLPEQMAASVAMAEQPSEAKEFIERFLGLMRVAGYPATSITPYYIRWLASIKSMLPCAWGGQIPPITFPNRHKNLDAYVGSGDWRGSNDPPVFIDMGCGFPPVTTAETAKTLPDWQVFGVDRSFPDYILYDHNGHYACFDDSGEFQYFQAMMDATGRALYQDPAQTRNYFGEHFRELSRLFDENAALPEDDRDGGRRRDRVSKAVERDGCRLIRNHVRNFEMDNLRFVRSEIDAVDLPPAQVIRSMNVYLYFEHETQAKMFRQAAELLDEGGILIIGTNGLALQSRYSIYRKEGDSLTSLEFAFSPDNLGPISFMPWFTIHPGDREAQLLNELSRVIRGDAGFWDGFSSRIEQILAQDDICWRGPDGFFQIPERQRTFAEYHEISSRMWHRLEAEGYLGGMVEALEKGGFEAHINFIGDIAIKPERGVLS